MQLPIHGLISSAIWMSAWINNHTAYTNKSCSDSCVPLSQIRVKKLPLVLQYQSLSPDAPWPRSVLTVAPGWPRIRIPHTQPAPWPSLLVSRQTDHEQTRYCWGLLPGILWFSGILAGILWFSVMPPAHSSTPETDGQINISKQYPFMDVLILPTFWCAEHV